MKYIYRKKGYIALFTVLDAVGNFLFMPFRRTEAPPDVKRILLIRSDHIGDVIAATAVIGPLTEKFPDTEVDLMVPSWARGLLEDDPRISAVVEFDAPWFSRRKTGIIDGVRGFFDMIRLVREGHYDVVVDLRGDVRHIAAVFLARARCRISYGITGGGFLLTHEVPYEGSIHETERALALLKPLGIDGVEGEVRLFSSGGDAALPEQVPAGDTRYAVVHAFPGHAAKEWSVRDFGRVVRYLKHEKGLVPVAVGSGSDSTRVSEMRDEAGVALADLAGRTSLAILREVIKGATLFVGVDSGPSHLAAAMGVPTLILFSGVNDPRQWAPRGENVKVIYPGQGKDLSSVRAEEVCREIDEALK